MPTLNKWTEVLGSSAVLWLFQMSCMVAAVLHLGTGDASWANVLPFLPFSEEGQGWGDAQGTPKQHPESRRRLQASAEDVFGR